MADGEAVGEIGPGLCLLLGVARDDDAETAERLAGRVARLRIFDNAEGKFDMSVLDTGGSLLVVSNFTLVADTAKGNRPSSPGARKPHRPNSSTRASARLFGSSACPSRQAVSARRCVSSSSMTGR